MIKILKWILLFIWQLPQNIIALILLLFIHPYSIKCIKRYAICIRAKRINGSISLGNFVILCNDSDTTCAHELGHVTDSHIFGWLYLFIIGIPSIVWAGFDIYKKKGVSYYSLYTERWANKNSHLHDERYYMYYILKFDEDYSLNSID